MIIVSGEPRSGTSMVMAIMKALGFKLAGDQWPKKNPDANPEGSWEVDDIVMLGMTEPIDGDVIKLMTPALFETSIDFIDKVIYCIRLPEEVIASQIALAEKQKMPPIKAEDLYRSHANSLYNVLSGLLPAIPTCLMNYNVALEEPKAIVDMIAGFVGAEPTPQAYKVIKKQYYHQKKG